MTLMIIMMVIIKMKIMIIMIIMIIIIIVIIIKNLFRKTAQYFLDVLNKPLYLQNGTSYRKMLHNIKVASFNL